MNEIVQKTFSILKTKGMVTLLILAGIVLMVLSNRGEKQSVVNTSSVPQTFVGETEERVEHMLESIAGVGECEVTITLLSTGKKEYVREEGKVLVITDNKGNQSAVLSKESLPEIAGVTVAIEGAMDLRVKNDIIMAVSTLLNVGTNKICVILRD